MYKTKIKVTFNWLAAVAGRQQVSSVKYLLPYNFANTVQEM